MKMVTIGELRSGMGAMFYEIKARGQNYLLTHGGKPVARLEPVNDVIEIMPDGSIIGEKPLTWKMKL